MVKLKPGILKGVVVRIIYSILVLISFCSLAYPGSLPLGGSNRGSEDPEKKLRVSYTVHHPVYHGQTAEIEIAKEDMNQFEKHWEPDDSSEIKGEIRYFFQENKKTRKIENLKLEPDGFISFTYIGVYYMLAAINEDHPDDILCLCAEENSCDFYPIFEN